MGSLTPRPLSWWSPRTSRQRPVIPSHRYTDALLFLPTIHVTRFPPVSLTCVWKCCCSAISISMLTSAGKDNSLLNGSQHLDEPVPKTMAPLSGWNLDAQLLPRSDNMQDAKKNDGVRVEASLSSLFLYVYSEQISPQVSSI